MLMMAMTFNLRARGLQERVVGTVAKRRALAKGAATPWLL